MDTDTMMMGMLMAVLGYALYVFFMGSSDTGISLPVGSPFGSAAPSVTGPTHTQLSGIMNLVNSADHQVGIA